MNTVKLLVKGDFPLSFVEIIECFGILNVCSG